MNSDLVTRVYKLSDKDLRTAFDPSNSGVKGITLKSDFHLYAEVSQ